MPGFPGLAIGAGLGQFEQQYQQQQALREREMQLRLTLAKFQQEQQDRQGQRELGGVDLAPPNSGGGGMPFYSTMPTQQPAAPPASGGGAHWTPAGIAALQPTEGRWDQIHYPSGRAPSGVKSSASGGLGYLDGTWREFAPKAGVDLNQFPRAYMAPEDVQRKVAAITPASHWTGNDKNGKPFNAAAQRLAENPANITGGGGQPTAPGQPQNLLGGGGQTGPQDDLRAQIAKIPPPSAGGLDLSEIMWRIKQQAPNATWQDKQRFLENYVRQHGPEATRQFQIDLDRYKTQVSTITEQFQHQRDRGETLTDRAATGGAISTGPGGEQFNVQGTTARPITRTDTGAPLVKEGPKKSSSNIQIVGEDGKDIFKGSAHPNPNAKEGESSWIDDKTQKPIEVPDTASVTILGKGGEGRQAAAQMVRLTSAANEARRQIGNVAHMAQGATTSWFQGVQAEQGRDLSEGVKRSLANELTPRDSQIMTVIGRGIGRSLASLETAGAATGLIALSNSMQQNMPAKGDAIETALVKLADMRQVAEQGIESAMAAPSVGAKQKELLQSVQDDIQKAIPYTVIDVLDLIQKPGTETYQSFAAKIGLGQKGGAFPPEAVEMLKKGDTPQLRQQFDATFGQGAAARALGGGAVPAAAPGAM